MRSILLFISIVVISAISFGAVYKWVDEDGRIYYSDKPADRYKTKEIDIDPGPSSEEINRSREKAEQLIQQHKQREGMRRPETKDDDDDFDKLLAHGVAAEQYRTKMDEFVELAVRGEASSLMALISRDAIQSSGAERINEALENEIIPFFSSYQKLHNVRSINPASGQESGLTGYWLDTYIVTLTGEVKPFSIVIIEEEGHLVVHRVIVNKCRKDRHPFCP